MNWKFHHRHYHRGHYGPRFHVVLTIGGFAVELIPEREIHMATTINAGQNLPFSIAFLDQNGQPMVPAPKPDAAPAWSNRSPATETLTASADGMTASAVGNAAGLDTVKVSLAVGGVTFNATLDVTVNAGTGTGSQTLTSIGIVAGTPFP